MKYKGREIIEKIYVAPFENDDLVGYKAAVVLDILETSKTEKREVR